MNMNLPFIIKLFKQIEQTPDLIDDNARHLYNNKMIYFQK